MTLGFLEEKYKNDYPEIYEARKEIIKASQINHGKPIQICLSNSKIRVYSLKKQPLILLMK